MAFDVYQPCPGGEDKKIKFCCGKDAVGDLTKVMDALRRGQRAAEVDIHRVHEAFGAFGEDVAARVDGGIVDQCVQPAPGAAGSPDQVAAGGLRDQIGLQRDRFEVGDQVYLLRYGMVATAEIVVPPNPDDLMNGGTLWLTVTDGVTSATAGSDLGYTITVTNHGTETATCHVLPTVWLP